MIITEALVLYETITGQGYAIPVKYETLYRKTIPEIEHEYLNLVQSNTDHSRILELQLLFASLVNDCKLLGFKSVENRTLRPALSVLGNELRDSSGFEYLAK